jgi:hypothetical protein
VALLAAKRWPELDTRSDHFRPPWITKWALLPISSATRNPWEELLGADAAAKAGMLLRKNFFNFNVFCGYIRT